MIAYVIANVLTHSPKRTVSVPQFEVLTCAAVVPLGHPYCGFVMVPSLKSSVSGLVVVGLVGTAVSVANATLLKK